MDTIVKSAMRQHRRNEEKRNNEERAARPAGKQRLWASDVGKCSRKAMMRLQGYESTIPFEDTSLDYMRVGVILEDDTTESLEGVYEDVESQLVLKTDCWSGRPDFAIGHGTDSPILIEHKVTGEKSWWNNYIPRKEHIGQVVLYGYTYEQLFGIKPKTLLFYRGWGHYAEYEITITDDKKILATGVMDDVPDIRQIDFDVMDSIHDLENWYESIKNDDTLPPKLRYKSHGCTFFGKPSCSMYHHCFKN